MMKSLLPLLLVLALVVPIQALAAPAPAIPTFIILDVVRDVSVTIKTSNFPAHDTFTVRMGAYGTLGIGGTVVGTQDSGAGGSFTATYTIPAGLHGSTRIAIRLQSPTSGYYSYNWFWNNTVNPTPGPTATPGGPTATPGPGAPPAGAGSIPTFTITAVDKNNTVTIKATNFTRNDTYNVRMNTFGTLGIGGAIVTTQATDNTGKFTATYNIPAALHGLARIAIRLESPATGYYSFNWFWNNDAP